MGFSMNEGYKKQTRDHPAEGMPASEGRGRQNKIWLADAALLLIAVLLIAFILSLRSSQPLEGTWAYGETAEVQFGGRGSGKIKLTDTNTECPFSYAVNENALQINFDNDYITDASYTFTVEEDTLTLVGGEGTMGGTYSLIRIEEG